MTTIEINELHNMIVHAVREGGANIMTSNEIKEMHDMIAHAVREGILSACKEMNKNADGTTTEDAFENAKSYCERLKSHFKRYRRLTDNLELVREMKKILTEEEQRYVLTHIHGLVGDENYLEAEDFVRTYVLCGTRV